MFWISFLLFLSHQGTSRPSVNYFFIYISITAFFCLFSKLIPNRYHSTFCGCFDLRSIIGMSYSDRGFLQRSLSTGRTLFVVYQLYLIPQFDNAKILENLIFKSVVCPVFFLF